LRTKSSPSLAPSRKNWWRGFFEPIVGEIMFAPKANVSEREVREVVKHTKAKPPLKLLDLACGTGRHALIFAKRGFDVTGLDYSKPFLREARRKARVAGRKIRFVHGDMRKLGSHFAANNFGLVVSLYNSFGYFDDRRDDAKLLHDVHRMLAPGGAFVINTINLDGAVKRLASPISVGREPLPNVFVIDAVKYDRRKRQIFATWTIVDARRSKVKVVRKSFRQNIYSHAELKRLLREAGFRIEAVWGMLPDKPFHRTSWHQTIVARKPR
jgi:ubiquinone/menaquinone biosynthesis C-methylase UbiE